MSFNFVDPILYDFRSIREEFTRVDREQRAREEAIRFLIYLARRDRRHLVIDKNPDCPDAWISVEAGPGEEVRVYIMDTSFFNFNL